jgi:AhpD family alkylhydroperoxidase
MIRSTLYRSEPFRGDAQRSVRVGIDSISNSSFLPPKELPMTRANYAKLAPELFKRYSAFGMALNNTSLDHTLRDLVTLRASQLNGCAFCIDMHVKEAKIHGERELRVHHVAIWRESTLFTPRERAALLWTETLTKLPEHGVSDEIYDSVKKEFSDEALAELTFAVIAINGWNRASIAYQVEPGSQDEAYGLTKAGLS